jgi:hypothetical protein
LVVRYQREAWVVQAGSCAGLSARLCCTALYCTCSNKQEGQQQQRRQHDNGASWKGEAGGSVELSVVLVLYLVYSYSRTVCNCYRYCAALYGAVSGFFRFGFFSPAVSSSMSLPVPKRRPLVGGTKRNQIINKTSTPTYHNKSRPNADAEADEGARLRCQR